jgi:hypothetical protein
MHGPFSLRITMPGTQMVLPFEVSSRVVNASLGELCPPTLVDDTQLRDVPSCCGQVCLRNHRVDIGKRAHVSIGSAIVESPM